MKESDPRTSHYMEEPLQQLLKRTKIPSTSFIRRIIRLSAPYFHPTKACGPRVFCRSDAVKGPPLAPCKRIFPVNRKME